MLFEKCKHHLRISSPPYRSSNEDGVILAKVNIPLVLRKFTVFSLFLGQIDKRSVSHAVILVRYYLKLLCTCKFSDIIGDYLRIADLDVSN